MSKNLQDHTWTEQELKEAMKEGRSSKNRDSSRHRSSHKSSSKEHRSKDDKDRNKERDDKERRREEKEKRRERESGDRHRDKGERHRDERDKEKHRDRHRDRDDDNDREERRKERHRDRDDVDRDNNREERRKERHRDRDDVDRDNNREERRKERHRDRDEVDKDNHREERRKERHRDRDEVDKDNHREERRKERHRDRDDKDRHKNREDDRERDKGDRDRHRDKEDRDRHKNRDEERERYGGDEEKERRHRDKEKYKDEEYYEKRKHKSDRDRNRSIDEKGKERHKDRHNNGESDAIYKTQSRNETLDDEESGVHTRKGKGDGINYETVGEKDDDYGGYDDDFEDYDDDFDVEDDEEENVSEDKIEYKQQTSFSDKNHQEDSSNNSISYSSKKSRINEAPKVDPRAPRALIDFFSARQRTTTSQVARRTKQRGRELLRLIDLDFTDADLFEQAPLQEYQLYMRSFGRSNTQQQSCQTNGDVWERDMQCEDIESRTLWTQHPPEDMDAVGIVEGHKTNKIASQYTTSHDTLSRLTGDAYLDENHNTDKASSLYNSLKIFLCILEEEAKPHVKCSTTEDGQTLAFSAGYSSLTFSDDWARIISQRWPCIWTSFSPHHSNVILTLHVSTHTHQWPQSFLFIWRVSSANEGPQEVLYSAQRATCAVFSSDMAASKVFLACEDGSISLYDLKEPLSSHGRISPLIYGTSKDDKVAPLLARAPSFIAASSWESEEDSESHLDSVISLQILSANSKWFHPGNRHKTTTLNTARSRKDSDDETDYEDQNAKPDQNYGKYDENNFQVASLDNQGHVCIWVVVRIHGNSVDLAGSESDLALRPGSRCRLSKTAAISVSSPYTSWSRKQEELSHWCGEVTTCLSLSPGDTRNFYIGTQSGLVIQQSRNDSGRGKLSRWFEPLSPSPVTSLDFHQFGMNLLLVGYEEGSILLFSTSRSDPLLILSDTSHNKLSPIRRVLWSRSRPSVFFSVNQRGVLSTWDLLQSISGPVDSLQYNVTDVALSRDTSAGTATHSGSARVLMSLWRRTGADEEVMEVHELSTSFSTGSMEEGYEMEKLIEDLS